jgi:cell filamentation protein
MPKTKISRYVVPQGLETEFQVGSKGRVLRNRLGITGKRQMDRMEFDALLEMQEWSLKTLTPDTRLTTELICALHRRWLGKIYPWAGVFRNVELQKGGFRWPPAFRVAQNMAGFETGLLTECTPCRPASLHVVALQMAKVHAEFLLIHPFRDGNGRLARWLAALMSMQAGFPLPEYQLAGKGSRKEGSAYLAAVTQGYGQNYDPLSAFFERTVRRRMGA